MCEGDRACDCNYSSTKNDSLKWKKRSMILLKNPSASFVIKKEKERMLKNIPNYQAISFFLILRTYPIIPVRSIEDIIVNHPIGVRNVVIFEEIRENCLG